MRYLIWFTVICTMVAIAVAAQQAALSKEPDENGLQITADELRNATIIGDLGVPLGTVVTVEGKYQDMTYTKRKADEGRIVLVIESVDGKKLENSVQFDTGRENSTKKDGERFKLVGCEYGEFWGGIIGMNARKGPALPGVHPRFGYYSHFSIQRFRLPRPPKGNDDTSGDRFGEE